MNPIRFLTIIAWLGAALTGCRFDGDIYNSYVLGDDTDLTTDTDAPIVSPITPTVAPNEFEFDIFEREQAGTVIWMDVSDETIATMNQDWQNGGFGGFWGIYNVDDSSTTVTLSDHLYVQLPNGSATDYKQIRLGVAGQSSGTLLGPNTIANINMEFDETVADQKLGGMYEHLRLNNGQVGGMFGEPSVLATMAGIGYPVPSTNYVLVGGRPWGNAEVLIPYIAVEKYKKSWCNKHADKVGGGCVNIWEGYSIDISVDLVAQFAQSCKIASCDITRLTEFAGVVSANVASEEFEELTAPYFDWTLYQEFQCNSWLLGTGDDAIHNLNNIVVIEGLDGKFRYLPYSTDISGTSGWGGAPLYGINAMSQGCQQDESCWAETIATCERQIEKLAALQPERLVDEEFNRLANIKYPWGDDGGDGALRSPDAVLFAIARGFYAQRAQSARAELEAYRSPPSDTGMFGY